MWQKIIETALLGTGNRPFDPAGIGKDIEDTLANRETDNETLFLTAAYYTWYYRESGKLPDKLSATAEPVLIEEEQEVFPPGYSKVFHLLENLHQRIREKVYNYWLDSLIEKNYLVSPDILVDLLYAGSQFSAQTRAKISKVIGKRGNWILTLIPELQYAEFLPVNEIWAEGNTNDRKAFLSKLLVKDPEQAVQMLSGTWETESLVNKKAFLEILREKLHPAVANFAENLHKGEFAYKTREKKTEKECRKLAAEILLAFEASELQGQTMEKLATYLGNEGKKNLLALLNSGNKHTFNLPAAEDADFWNAANMEQVYGLEPKNYDISLFKDLNQSWLDFFLSGIPVNAWLGHFGGSHGAFLACFLDNEPFKMKSGANIQLIFWDSLVNNALYFRDNMLTLYLLPRMQAAHAAPLLKNLKPAEFEEYIRKTRMVYEETVLESGPYSLSESWSQPFSEYILKQMYDLAMQSNSWKLSGLGIVVARFVHPGAGTFLQSLHSKASLSANYPNWENHIYTPVSRIIQIKNLINQLNSV